MSIIGEELGKTVYECWQNGKLVAYAGSENGCLEWLSLHGGGTYKNTLHGFQFTVKEGEYKFEI